MSPSGASTRSRWPSVASSRSAKTPGCRLLSLLPLMRVLGAARAAQAGLRSACDDVAGRRREACSCGSRASLARAPVGPGRSEGGVRSLWDLSLLQTRDLEMNAGRTTVSEASRTYLGVNSALGRCEQTYRMKNQLVTPLICYAGCLGAKAALSRRLFSLSISVANQTRDD